MSDVEKNFAHVVIEQAYIVHLMTTYSSTKIKNECIFFQTRLLRACAQCASRHTHTNKKPLTRVLQCFGELHSVLKIEK